MNEIPAHLRYTAEHEWVETLPDNKVRVGITDFAQRALGDIVFVLTPKIGESVRAGGVCGEVESTKSVSEIYSPVSGTICAINDALLSNPETINGSPYGDGWLFEINSVSALEIEALLTDQGYHSLTSGE